MFALSSPAPTHIPFKNSLAHLHYLSHFTFRFQFLQFEVGCSYRLVASQETTVTRQRSQCNAQIHLHTLTQHAPQKSQSSIRAALVRCLSWPAGLSSANKTWRYQVNILKLGLFGDNHFLRNTLTLCAALPASGLSSVQLSWSHGGYGWCSVWSSGYTLPRHQII